jgi:alpha-1,3-fucosyltransferase 10
LQILYGNTFFDRPLSQAGGMDPKHAADLCEVITDPARAAEADAVVFHFPDLKRRPTLEKRPGQLWVSLSVEADQNYPQQADPAFRALFDLRMDYTRHADVRMMYFYPSLDRLRVPPRWKFRQASAVYFASNGGDHNGRRQLVLDLMGCMRVDSYGRSLRNRRLWLDRGHVTKMRILSGYHFNLAFENSNEPDYVSEKVFDALVAGTVPVYLGADNVDEVLPGKKCVIKAADFSDARSLADYLRYLRRHPRAYAEYFEWKQQPFNPSFLALAEQQREPLLRRLCLKLRERLG